MNIDAWISPTKLLALEAKSSDDNTIHWFEGVVMNGTDVNTVTIDKSIAKDLEVGKAYDFLLRISETQKASKNGQVFKVHKFKITDYQESN